MCGNGREKKCIAEQSEGIAERSVAVFSKEVQRHSIVAVEPFGYEERTSDRQVG